MKTSHALVNFHSLMSAGDAYKRLCCRGSQIMRTDFFRTWIIEPGPVFDN